MLVILWHLCQIRVKVNLKEGRQEKGKRSLMSFLIPQQIHLKSLMLVKSHLVLVLQRPSLSVGCFIKYYFMLLQS